MALTTEQRRKLWAAFMARGHCPGAVTKAEALDAVGAMDDFLDTNAATINSAFPLPFRTEATTEQKAMVVAYVALERAGGL